MTNVADEPRQQQQGDLNGAICALANLRVLRASRGLSLNQVAKRTGMSPGYLQKLERCQIRNPSPHKLAALADVLHYDYDKLMELAGYPVTGSSPDRELDQPKPAKVDCITILEEAARSAGIEQREAEILAEVIHELTEAKKTGLNIKRDLLPRVVRSLRELHAQGVDVSTLDDALSDVELGPRRVRVP